MKTEFNIDKYWKINNTLTKLFVVNANKNIKLYDSILKYI